VHFDRWPTLIWPPLALLILFLTVGGFVLWLGMMWNCVVASEMSVRSRVLWMILIVPTPNLGALIYYYCVFKRQPVQQAQEQARQSQV
jgi:hypothetical protein